MRSIPHKTIYNHTLYVNPDDEIGKEIIRKGIYDKTNIETLLLILKNIESPIVFDVGANIGNHAISISPVCATVHAFEPDAYIMSILEKNVRTNNIHNIITNEYGLSNTSGYSDFYINLDGNIGASTLEPCNKSSNYKKSRVYLNKGDKYVFDNNIKKIDLLKIDVEGHEIQVLEGMEDCISTFKPIILMEWSSEKSINDASSSQVFHNISKNYKVYTALSSRDKTLWRTTVTGKLKRVIHKAFGKEKWHLVASDLTKHHANIFLVPTEKQHHVSDLVITDD